MQLLKAGLAAIMILAASTHSSEGSPKKARKGLLLVANKGDHTLGIIDLDSGRQLAAIPEGGVTGHEVIASPDGRFAYVPIYGDSGVGKAGSDGSSLVVVDLAARKVIGHLAFGHGVRPHCPMFGPKNGLLYVTTELDNTVSVIDPRVLKVVGSVPTGQAESHMLAISRDGRRGYTANVGPGTVSALDLENRKTIAVIPISGQTQRISLSADDKLAFTADQTKPRLAVIDTATNKLRQWIALPGSGYGTAPTPDGRFLIVAIPSRSLVGVVDLHSMEVVRSIDVPRAPQEVLVSPDGRVAYVSCDASHQIAEIALQDWTVKRLIEAGRGADGLAWARAE
jgi:YVTN family beta-propeller protein